MPTVYPSLASIGNNRHEGNPLPGGTNRGEICGEEKEASTNPATLPQTKLLNTVAKKIARADRESRQQQ